jgi:alkylhydroperoxidase family enzyme
MIRAIIRAKLASVERDLGVNIDYLRHILDTSLRAFLKFTKIMPLAEYRRTLPVEPYHVARLVATRDADCGTCLQIEVNLARRDRVTHDIVRAVVEGRADDLPTDLAEVYRFTEAVVRAADDRAAELREHIRERYGEAGLVELSLAIAACRVFPTVKRGLGFATSCAKVRLEL